MKDTTICENMADRADMELPPMPGETPKQTAPKKSVEKPFVVYIKGKPTELTSTEAISVMGQIINIMSFYDQYQ